MTRSLAPASAYAQAPPRSADKLVQQAGAGVLDDLMEGVEAVIEAHDGYETAEQYYLGTREEFFASAKFKKALERTGTTFRLNYASTPVDTVVERLEINDIIGGDTQTRRMLQAIWEMNQMDIESMDIHRRTCEFGDGPVFVWPIDPDDESNDPNIGLDITYNDPRTVRFIYDKESPRKVLFVIKLWCSRVSKANGDEYRATLYYRDRTEKYVTKPGDKFDQAESWMRYTEVDENSEPRVWPMPNPYGQIPWFHFRTDRPYGVPEHMNAYGPQDAITKIVITQMTTMDYHSFPQRWALMSDEIDDDDGDGEDFGLADIIDDDDETGSEISPDKTQMKSEPGHMWFLRGVKGVGQFDAAGADVFMSPMTSYIRAMAQVTRTPVHRFDSQGNPPSGQSLRVAEQPFIKKVKYRQMSFGATWADLLAFVVKILQTEGADAIRAMVDDILGPEPDDPTDEESTNSDQGDRTDPTTGLPAPAHPARNASQGRLGVSWMNPAAQDDQLTWNIAIMKIDTGIPHRQVLLEAGYSKAKLDEWGVPASKWVVTAPPAAPGAPPAPGRPMPGPGKVEMVDGQPVQQPDVPTHLPGFRVNPIGTTGKLD